MRQYLKSKIRFNPLNHGPILKPVNLYDDHRFDNVQSDFENQVAAGVDKEKKTKH